MTCALITCITVVLVSADDLLQGDFEWMLFNNNNEKNDTSMQR